MGSRERSSWFIFEIKRVPQMRFDQVKTAHGTQYEIVIKDVALAYYDCELDMRNWFLDC